MIRTQHTGPICVVTFSRPPVNAINPQFVAAFQGVLDELKTAQSTVVVIRSDQKCFSAGADLGVIRGYFTAPGGTAQMVAFVKSLHEIYNELEALPAVTLAVIDGPALGGGLELALACDLRIATPRAKLGLPEAGVGMIPGAGGTQRLPRLCGPGIAARLILGGELVDGAEAARIGLVQWAADAADLDARVTAIAARIAGLSRPALLASKDCIAAWFDPRADGFARELEKPWALMETTEARSRIDKFFTPRSA